MTCRWCGSERHDDDHCRIRQKVQALERGESADFVVFEASTPDELIDALELLRSPVPVEEM